MFQIWTLQTSFSSLACSIYHHYTTSNNAIQFCKSLYRSQFTYFLSGCSSVYSGSASITARSFLSRFNSILRAFSRSDFSFSFYSKVKGFYISTFVLSSYVIVSIHLVFTDSNRVRNLANLLSIQVRFPESQILIPLYTLLFHKS